MEFEQVKELVRFGFRDRLIRITRETGFEHRDEEADAWVKTQDLNEIFDQLAAQALDVLVVTASVLDGLERDMGKQVFLAAIRTPGMKNLGFWDAALN